jgi:hypothetical protein
MTPPELTTVASATPPDEMYSIPPFKTIVPLTVWPEETL